MQIPHFESTQASAIFSAVAFALLGVVLLLIALARLLRSNLNLLDPLTALAFGASIYYGFANAAFCLIAPTQVGAWQLEGLWFDPSETEAGPRYVAAATMTWLMAIGVAIGAALGALAGVGQWIAWKLRPAPGARPGPLVMSGLATLALIAILPREGALSSVTSRLPHPIFAAGFAALYWANIALWSRVHSLRSSAILLPAAFTCLMMLYGSLSAMRENILSPVVAAVCGLVMATKSRMVLLAVCLTSVPIYLAVTGWNYMNRSELWSDGPGRAPLVERAETVLRNLADARPGPAAPDGSEQLAWLRVATIIPMTATLEAVERGDRITVSEGLTAPLVPRLLWPSKPRVTVGDSVYYMFTGRSGSSNSPGLPAEAFMYFGWAGVLPLGILLGGFCGVLQPLSSRIWRSKNALMAAASLPNLILWAKCENIMHAYIASVPTALLLLTIARWIQTTGSRTPLPRGARTSACA